jgi:response regulator RpfG family c-di-GMP phosphodiesterase
MFREPAMSDRDEDNGRFSEQIARALTSALCERDGHTREHSERVATLALRLGEQCGLSERELRLLAIAANMHDIGKIGIPDKVLLKPAAFVSEEWEIMKSHAERGERILRSIDFDGVDEVATAVRHHHEHFDGGGYPDRLHGEDIPVIARILSIVDSYDAMTMRRPYHAPLPHKQAVMVLYDEAGEKHDPALLTYFLHHSGRLH